MPGQRITPPGRAWTRASPHGLIPPGWGRTTTPPPLSSQGPRTTTPRSLRAAPRVPPSFSPPPRPADWLTALSQRARTLPAAGRYRRVFPLDGRASRPIFFPASQPIRAPSLLSQPAAGGRRKAGLREKRLLRRPRRRAGPPPPLVLCRSPSFPGPPLPGSDPRPRPRTAVTCVPGWRRCWNR